MWILQGVCQETWNVSVIQMLVLSAGILTSLKNGCLMYYLLALVNVKMIARVTRLEAMADTLVIRPFLAVMVVRTCPFTVREGEVIGTVMPRKKEEEEKENLTVPGSVDYFSGAVLVDTAVVKDWSGGKILYPREYFDMYYSFDGESLESIPISRQYWSSDVRNKYAEIKNLIKRPKEPFRSWGGKVTGTRIITTITSDDEGEFFDDE